MSELEPSMESYIPKNPLNPKNNDIGLNSIRPFCYNHPLLR